MKSPIGNIYPMNKDRWHFDQRWWTVAVMAFVLLWLSFGKAHAQITSSNPLEYVALAEGNELINGQIKTQIDDQQKTALLQNGIAAEFTMIHKWEKKYNSYLDVEGVAFTMYSGRLNLTLQVVEQVKKFFGDKVYKTTVPRNVRLSEAPSYGQPINFYDPSSKGCEAYMDMAKEFLRNNERK